MPKITTESIQRESIKNRLSELYVERVELLERIETISTLIKFFEDKYNNSHAMEGKEPSYLPKATNTLQFDSTNHGGSNYIFEGIEEDILYILSEVIKKCALISDIQSVYNGLFGSQKNIGSYLRKLKREKKVIAIRYNRINQLTYWGTPEMLNVYKTDFDQEFKQGHTLSKPLKSIEIL